MEFEVKIWKPLLLTWHKRTLVIKDNIFQIERVKFGKKKEKDLNTASNVLAGATAVASATSTVFSGTQIAAIKRVANVASKCEGVLK